MSALPVRYEALVVGDIALSEDGPTFPYDLRWPRTRGAFPLSLRMPLDAGPFASATLLPRLANLLPEEGNLLAIGRNLGRSPEELG